MRKSLLLLAVYIVMIFAAKQLQATDKKQIPKNLRISSDQRQQFDYVLNKGEKNKKKASQINFTGYDFGDVTELSYIEK